MLGAIIGDIVGSRFEFNNTSDFNFELFYRCIFIHIKPLLLKSYMVCFVLSAVLQSFHLVKHNQQ